MSILECIPLKATDDMLIHSIIHTDNSQSLLSPYPTRKGINQPATSWTTKLRLLGLGFRFLQAWPGPTPLSLKPWKKMFARWHPHIPPGMNDVYPKPPRCKPNYSFYHEIEKIRFTHIGTLQSATCSVLAVRANSNQAVKLNLWIQVWV